MTLHYVRPGKRLTAFISRDQISKGEELVDSWKLFFPEGYNGGDAIPHQIVGRPILAGPGEVCTGTYIAIGPFESLESAESARSYYATKFFRFLVSLRKITQHTGRSTFNWVPTQSWNRVWTDEALFDHYGITADEIAFIESQVKSMELNDG